MTDKNIDLEEYEKRIEAFEFVNDIFECDICNSVFYSNYECISHVLNDHPNDHPDVLE